MQKHKLDRRMQGLFEEKISNWFGAQTEEINQGHTKEAFECQIEELRFDIY